MYIPFRAYIKRSTLVSIRSTLQSFYHNLVQPIFSLIKMGQPEPELSLPEQESSAPFDPTRPSVPISYPLKTLEELKSRSYFDSFHYPFNKVKVKLQSDSNSLPNRPRILVCHDMQGGYLDDKWVQGDSNRDAYAIWHWYLMDIFVYFSHNLVTIPPPCWVDTAHRHGVKVLGTFLTEWDEGKATCDTLLSTKESAQMYAERLSELAVALGFDGWLINMEVKLDTVQIPNLKEFVSHLTQTMHSSMPGSLVIWYDGVTVDGDLGWQDQLNDKNKAFFELCDGLFVNYTWKEDYPKRSADVAGNRKYDLYMGIDVFGRNTFGGGQWTTNVALDLIKKSDVSAAIFAPGWVYETKQPPDFQTAQNHWWALVEKSWGLLQSYPKTLPFYSNFDQGHGYHFSIDGKQVSDASWSNISCQGLQPLLEYTENHLPGSIEAFIDFDGESYSGGGNITFRGNLEDNSFITKRLFRGRLSLSDLPLQIAYSVKSGGESRVGLHLELSSPSNERKSILLASSGSTLPHISQLSRKFTKVIMPNRVSEPDAASGWVIQESSIAMDGHTLTEINTVCYWADTCLRKSKEDSTSQDESIAKGQYHAVLGYISVCTSENRSKFPAPTAWLVEGQYINWTSASHGSKAVSLKIIWNLKNGNDSPFFTYNIFVQKLPKQAEAESLGKMAEEVPEYLGVAQRESFYVSELAVSSGISTLRFIIQVCGADGACQKLDDSPSLQLDVEGQ